MGKLSVLIVMVFGVLLAGCDQITALFPGQKKAVQANPVASKPAPAVETAETASETAPLAANVLARVGKWVITVDEFNERLDNLKQVLPEFDTNDVNTKKLVLEELIRQQLLVAEAEKTGISKQKDIAAAVEDFRRTLLVQEIANTITKDISVTEEEAKQFYEENKGDFAPAVEWKIREIVAYTQQAANDILVQLLQGADFAETAKAQSKGKTASEGGDLGVITQMPSPQMQAIVENLEIGQVSSVFKGQDDYFYIVKLEDKKGGDPAPFEEVKQDLISGLTLRKQQQAVLDYLEELVSKTKIDVNDQLLGEGS